MKITNSEWLLLGAGVAVAGIAGYFVWKASPSASAAAVPANAQPLPEASSVTMPGTYAPGSPGSWT